jgi:hypothetical protein
MDRTQLLTELCLGEGWKFLWDEHAADREDAMGLPQRDELCAQACKHNVVAMNPKLNAPLDAVLYALSHEIAEARCGFTGHHQLLWREQLNILCRWGRILALAVR